MISRILVVPFWGLFSLSVSAQEQREMTVSGRRSGATATSVDANEQKRTQTQ